MEKQKHRIMLTVAYDGTNYHGWQLQPSAITIEKVLNEALSEVLEEEITVIGASRTDAGVHALCNKAVFDTTSSIPANRFPLILKHVLPSDVCVLKGEDVSEDFHPRKCDTEKTYEYRISNSEFVNPMKRLYTLHFAIHLDENAMDTASKFLLGEHDFTSFCNVDSVAETKVRTITDIGVRRENEDVIIKVTGTGFLYNMVRIIAGTLIEVGRGHKDIDFVKNALEARDRQASGPTAPPEGLTLVKYEFK